MPLKEKSVDFVNTSKLILKEKLSTNPQKLEEYRVKIIEKYNRVIDYINKNYHCKKRIDQITFDECLLKSKERFIRCLDKLHCEYKLSDLNGLIRMDDIGLPKISEINFNLEKTNSLESISKYSEETNNIIHIHK